MTELSLLRKVWRGKKKSILVLSLLVTGLFLLTFFYLPLYNEVILIDACYWDKVQEDGSLTGGSYSKWKIIDCSIGYKIFGIGDYHEVILEEGRKP